MERTRHFRFVSTNELRDNLSETLNRAAFGKEPVIVTRRGRKIAGIISIDDLIFLERMKKRRSEVMAAKLQVDTAQTSSRLARQLQEELLFL